ncbi:MAG: hypothetical protein LJE64_01505 [Desulfofustis sp.]|nr:hypothetical protein [Desulfofustis sp.]
MTSTEPTRPHPGRSFDNPLHALSGKKRIALTVLAVLVIVVTVTLIHLIRISGYRLLYANLSADDAVHVTSWLNIHDIGFRTKNFGRDIYVAGDRVYQTRFDLSRELPAGTSGSLRPTPSSSALDEQELARTIASLDGVEYARVRISRGETAGFETSEPHASILIQSPPDSALSRDDLESITSLASQVIPDLHPEHVDIYDASGRNLFSGKREAEVSNVPSPLLLYQQSLERRLEQRAGETVDALIGSGRAMIRVTVTLDNSRSESTSEQFDPDRTAVKKELTEYAPGSRYTPAEQTDQIQFLPPVPTTASIDYELNRTVKKTVKPAGAIERISVSILLAGKPPEHQDDQVSSSATSEEELLALESAVSNVLSLRPERGDSVTIIPIPDRADKHDFIDSEPVRDIPYHLILPVFKMVMTIVGFGLLYLLIVRPLLDILSQKEVAAKETMHTLGPERSEDEEKPQTDEDPTAALKDEILRNPSATVHIIKNWLQET